MAEILDHELNDGISPITDLVSRGIKHVHVLHAQRIARANCGLRKAVVTAVSAVTGDSQSPFIAMSTFSTDRGKENARLAHGIRRPPDHRLPVMPKRSAKAGQFYSAGFAFVAAVLRLRGLFRDFGA